MVGKFCWEVFDSRSFKITLITNVPNFMQIRWQKEGACCVGGKIILVGFGYVNKFDFIAYDFKIEVFSQITNKHQRKFV